MHLLLLGVDGGGIGDTVRFQIGDRFIRCAQPLKWTETDAMPDPFAGQIDTLHTRFQADQGQLGFQLFRIGRVLDRKSTRLNSSH